MSTVQLSVHVDEEVSLLVESEGVTSNASVTPLGDRRYRIDAVPMFVESFSYLDVVEAEVVDEHTLKVLRVSERSGWHVHTFLMPAKWRDIEQHRDLADEAVRRGGHWENLMGGVLFICMPPHCTDWPPSD